MVLHAWKKELAGRLTAPWTLMEWFWFQPKQSTKLYRSSLRMVTLTRFYPSPRVLHRYSTFKVLHFISYSIHIASCRPSYALVYLIQFHHPARGASWGAFVKMESDCFATPCHHVRLNCPHSSRRTSSGSQYNPNPNISRPFSERNRLSNT